MIGDAGELLEWPLSSLLSGAVVNRWTRFHEPDLFMYHPDHSNHLLSFNKTIFNRKDMSNHVPAHEPNHSKTRHHVLHVLNALLSTHLSGTAQTN